MQPDPDMGDKTDKTTAKERLKGHRLSLTCVCIDSANLHAFTGSKDGSIIKWCLRTRRILGKINSIKKDEQGIDKSRHDKHHIKHVNCLAISSDDKLLASGGWDKLIRIWSPEDLRWLHTFSHHRQEITAMAFRQGHPMLYSGSADRSVMLWTLEDEDNRCFIEALYGHESSITSLDVLKKERVLTAGGRDQSIRVWKIVEQAQTVYESKHESVDIVRFVDNETFVSGGEDGTISVWTTMKRKPVFSLRNAHESPELTCEKYGPNCKLNQKAIANWISALAAFSLNSSKQVKEGRKKQKLDDQGIDVPHENDDDDDLSSEDDAGKESTISRVTAFIASGSNDSEIRVWKLLKTGSKYELQLHLSMKCPGFVNDLRFTNDCKKLVAACGQEHKFGRWWKLKGPNNCIRIFDLNLE